MKLVAAIGLALLLASCSPGPESYKDVDAIVTAMGEADLACDEVPSEPPGDIVRDQGTCRTGGSEHDIFVFEDEKARDRWLVVGGGIGEVVVGPNWVVVPGEDADDVADALDGEIR